MWASPNKLAVLRTKTSLLEKKFSKTQGSSTNSCLPTSPTDFGPVSPHNQMSQSLKVNNTFLSLSLTLQIYRYIDSFIYFYLDIKLGLSLWRAFTDTEGNPLPKCSPFSVEEIAPEYHLMKKICLQVLLKEEFLLTCNNPNVPEWKYPISHTYILSNLFYFIFQNIFWNPCITTWEHFLIYIFTKIYWGSKKCSCTSQFSVQRSRV